MPRCWTAPRVRVKGHVCIVFIGMTAAFQRDSGRAMVPRIFGRAPGVGMFIFQVSIALHRICPAINKARRAQAMGKIQHMRCVENAQELKGDPFGGIRVNIEEIIRSLQNRAK